MIINNIYNLICQFIPNIVFNEKTVDEKKKVKKIKDDISKNTIRKKEDVYDKNIGQNIDLYG